MADAAADAFFIGSGAERRFAVLTSPRAQEPRAALLFVHPFAEELNKSRRMTALAARTLAERGCAILQIDLQGCGDSSGDFGDATWEGWVNDVAMAHAWLRQETGLEVGLWSLRAGALLAAASLSRIATVSGLLFWQPVLSGTQFLRQFLRLKVAGNVLAGGSSAGGTRDLLDALAKGETVEVAGYALPPALALPLEQANLDLAAGAACGRIVWLEVSPAEPASMSPAAMSRIDAWRGAGFEVEARAVVGPQFWQSQEIEDCPALVEATAQLYGND